MPINVNRGAATFGLLRPSGDNNTVTEKPPLVVEPPLPKRPVDPSFLNMAKEVTAGMREKSNQLFSQLDALPAGILSNPSDVERLRTIAAELRGANPVAAGDQAYTDQVFQVLRTDFAQTEVPGLAPAGDVFQVLAEGDTRANYSQFKRPDGAMINAVEISKVTPGLSGANLAITGLFAFEAVQPPLSPNELLSLTKGIRKTIDIADRLRSAKGDAPPVGARDVRVLNEFIDVIAAKDSVKFASFLPSGITPEARDDIMSLEARITPDERKVLDRIGQALDLNTNLGPVNGGVATIGLGFQQFLSKQGNQPNDRVVFQSGSRFNLEGLPVDQKTAKPGDRGYTYTFEAKRLPLETAQ
jgi:hypothetical protein